MSSKRYLEEFKIEAVKHVLDRGHSVSSFATRLDITTHSLYAWMGWTLPFTKNCQMHRLSICRLRNELKRVTDELK
ncbi:transposase [Salmonella enterica subsp. enterica serovar Braenderup]|nr:transposase [Salmonella enterica subsp. enterica serovar Braenderup]